MPSLGWRVVLQIDCPSLSECRRFDDIPVVDPVHIAIVAEAPEASNAVRLYRELESLIGGLTSGATAQICGHARLLGCMARHEPTCRSVLVPVTGSTAISRSVEDLMRDWIARSNSTIVPVLPSGARPSGVLPYPYDKLGALFVPGRIELLAPDILRAAGLGGDDYRLFLSYRRADAQDLADQLFDAFSRRGFEVFLDRFRGTPGRAFPRELAEELSNKGLVLVLESPNIRLSKWTLAEVSIALLFRLGLLAVAMPGGPPMSSISGSARWTPDPRDWNGGRLADSACDDLVEFVRRSYLKQVTYRRMYLETLLRRALAGQGLTSQPGVDGVHQVVGGGSAYAIHLASRPPKVGDARRVTTAAAAGGAASVLVGPYGLLSPASVTDLRWLAGELNITLRREGEIRRLAAAMAAGSVPP